MVWCSDANNNGCADESDTSTISIDWTDGDDNCDRDDDRDRDEDNDRDRDRDDDRDRDQGGNASSYINPDTGAATENTDVDPDSSCFSPDQDDSQALSPPGTAKNNVHNDACFLDDRGDKVDGPASFESSGVGFISACPDPDGAGPKVAMLSPDRLRCFQSGYQEKGMAGDEEFLARLNNDSDPGQQVVVWCADANNNGCSDESNKSTITIDWTS
ncbi:hypothetical protein BH24CHL4_BH24CHL4_18400 [soil metagenome]